VQDINTSIVYGMITKERPLVVPKQMAENGVNDGIRPTPLTRWRPGSLPSWVLRRKKAQSSWLFAATMGQFWTTSLDGVHPHILAKRVSRSLEPQEDVDDAE
jgi:hypothetical protein